MDSAPQAATVNLGYSFASAAMTNLVPSTTLAILLRSIFSLVSPLV